MSPRTEARTLGPLLLSPLAWDGAEPNGGDRERWLTRSQVEQWPRNHSQETESPSKWRDLVTFFQKDIRIVRGQPSDCCGLPILLLFEWEVVELSFPAEWGWGREDNLSF